MVLSRDSVVTRLPLATQTFIEMIRNQLMKPDNNRSSLQSARLGHALPTDPGFYEAFSFAYYIDCDRTGNFPPAWKWEEVALRSIKSTTADPEKLLFKGRIKNSFQVHFTVEAEKFGSMFAVHATQDINFVQDSIERFVAVFTWCAEDRGVMYGVWSGLTRDKSPVTYATVWSHERLVLDQIRQISREGMMHSVMSVETGHDFANQPLQRTLTPEA